MDGSVGLGEAVEWPEVLRDLRRHGFGVVRVAEALNLPRQTVQSWQDGTEPRYTNGLMLVRLYLVVVGKQHEMKTRFAVPVAPRR